MKEIIVRIRDTVTRFIYKRIVKPVYFRFDPERVHDMKVRFAVRLGSNPVTRAITRAAFGYSHPALRQTVAGIEFPNPIGLAAGFDKGAELTRIFPEVGFGFEEVGSVTGEPCAGNPKPRLWRHPEMKSLRVHYGLKNDGAERIAKRLAGERFRIPIGISIAKTNSPETAGTDAGIRDYVKAYRALKGIGDYVTVNISCPNAFGGQPFTDPERLDRLFGTLTPHRDDRPIFIKLSPDLAENELDAIMNVTARHNITGFISTNLTKKHGFGDGGISGKAVEAMSDDQIRYLYSKTGGRSVIIGCGGIFSAEDAYRKIRAGASLVQLITGMIYEGPQVISELNRGLVRLLKKDGFSNMSEAVGADHG